MESLHLVRTKSTPDISFDQTTGILKMSGESYPENSFEFYKPIILWVSQFAQRHSGPVTLEINLSYLNTGSIKCLMDILDHLEEMHRKGSVVTINWYYDQENDRALETAQDFQEEVTLPFNIVPSKEDS